MRLSLNKEHSIGVFDSGVGGLTVMRQIMQKMPNESIIYFGDTARIPYGSKSKETIIRYSIENTIFLLQKNIKLLVVACNTATAQALDKLQQIFNIPIIGVIEPGAEEACRASKNQRIAVLGTRGTIKSGAYQREIQKRLPNSAVFPVACPLFVPLVEERFYHHPASELIVKEYIQPLLKNGVDTVLLGCTHYPLLKEQIQVIVGHDVTLVDSAMTCANKVVDILQGYNGEANERSKPTYSYYVSDDPENFRLSGKEFLGNMIDHVECIATQ